MHFSLLDRVLEVSPTRIVTLKHVSAAEEYLQDHFPTFPVLPGVMMLECMVAAARELAISQRLFAKADAADASGEERLVLGQVRALKYGAFVAPGSSLRIEVDLHKRIENGHIEFKGIAVLLDPQREAGDTPTAVSGRFVLRPVHHT